MFIIAGLIHNNTTVAHLYDEFEWPWCGHLLENNENGRTSHYKNLPFSPKKKGQNWGGKYMLLFPNLNKGANWACSAKKKNVPNSAKIIGECFAEFLFCRPARPGGLWPGLIWASPKNTLVQHWRSWATPEHPFDAGPMCFWGRPWSGPMGHKQAS